jgi:hypothetical protein
MKYRDAKYLLVRLYLTRRLRRADGRVERMAEDIGVTRAGAYKILRAHHIDPAPLRGDTTHG